MTLLHLYTNLIVRELVSNVCHQVSELRCCDGSCSPFVKHPERRSNEIFVIYSIHLLSHHVAKLRKLYEAGTISVKLKKIIPVCHH